MACLILLLAAPAAAMPACAPQQPSEHHGHHTPEVPAQPDHAMPDHGCIGCATPMRTPLALNDRALPPRAAPQRPIDLQIPEGATLRPALPPPRKPA